MDLITPTTTDSLEPPNLDPPLRLAIAGRKGAGKTTLFSQIRSIWGAPETAPTNIPVRRTRTPIFSSFFSSRIGVLAARSFRFIAKVVNVLRRPSECDSASLRNGGTIWDPVLGDASVAIADAVNSQVDLILFVTRLDDGRVSVTDRLLLAELVGCFGEDVLEKTLFVLTHGRATPPVDLSFEEFVRGRRDLLWQHVARVLPPLQLPPREELESSPVESLDEREESASRNEELASNGVGEDQQISEGGGEGEEGPRAEIESLPNDEKDGSAPDAASVHEGTNIEVVTDLDENGTDGPDGQDVTTGEDDGADVHGEGRNGEDPFRIRPDKLDELFGQATSEMSLGDDGEGIIEEFWKDLIDPKDNRVFAERDKPPVIVVEMSDACATDEEGRKTLPDGTAWVPNLLGTIGRMVRESRCRRVAEGEEEEEEGERDGRLGMQAVEERPRFWRQIGAMVDSLRRDMVRLFLAEIAIVVLGLQGGRAIQKYRERRRQRELDSIDDDDEVLLEMSDEEYEKITKIDNDGKPLVVYDDMDEEEKARLGQGSEKEFFAGGDKGLDLDAIEKEMAGAEKEDGESEGKQSETGNDDAGGGGGDDDDGGGSSQAEKKTE